MNNTFGSITQPFNKNKISKNNTSVIELLMFHDTRVIKPKKNFRFLSCFIYTLIDNYVCICYLDCQSKMINQIYMDSKYVEK